MNEPANCGRQSRACFASHRASRDPAITMSRDEAGRGITWCGSNLLTGRSVRPSRDKGAGTESLTIARSDAEELEDAISNRTNALLSLAPAAALHGAVASGAGGGLSGKTNADCQRYAGRICRYDRHDLDNQAGLQLRRSRLRGSEVSPPHLKGQLTPEQQSQLAAALSAAAVETLPARIGEPAPVNSRQISIEYGGKTAVLNLGMGDPALLRSIGRYCPPRGEIGKMVKAVTGEK